MASCDLVLRDATLPDGRRADIGLKEGKVVHTGAVEKSGDVIDCHGKLLLPAATDMHVHMRGGNQAEKEDWRSGTMSAIAGGVTLVVDQPNTVPPLTTPSRFADRLEEALCGTCCGFAINAGVAPGTDLSSLWYAGAMAFGEIFAGPSSYGEALSPQDLGNALREIQQIGGLATIHAENVGTSTPGTLAAHQNNRNPEGEADAVNQVCQINTSGCRLHFCHLSSGKAIGAVLEQRRVSGRQAHEIQPGDMPGMISFEVTPHHLLLSFEGFLQGNTCVKVNPPVRDNKIQAGLWEEWDRIDVIASDHAPHTATDKAVEFSRAPSGIPGVETMVPLLLAEVLRRKIPVTTLVEKVSRKPCEILGIPRAGFQPGERADFALYNTGNCTRVNSEDLHSRAGWSPFEGNLAIFPDLVIMGGRIVYQTGDFFDQDPVWYPGRGYHITR
jgi:dihydroorotase